MPAQKLAPRLIGCVLVRVLADGTRLSGRIIETEAYVGIKDAGCHSYRGRRTPRNEAMYARGGTAYVYFTYGMHWCMNIVCGKVDEPVAVLLRALEPLEGEERMRGLRSAGRKAAGPLRTQDLCSGPAKLCAAMGIDRAMNGVDMLRSDALFIEMGPQRRGLMRGLTCGPRVGLSERAGEWREAPLRWLQEA
jgi:DNA-3-methyladenine glycosylase